MQRLVIIAVLLIASLFNTALAAPASAFNPLAAPDFGLTAKSAILIEATTGRVIFEKNADAREYPASMTKMMTCILSLEKTKPTDVIHIADAACSVGGSSLYLQKGDIMTMQQLRQGMMLVSGNDAAVAIACAVSGSVPAFVDLMNEKAKSIGALNTHFDNPNGLPDKNHYSTARDMAKIADYCYQNAAFRKIVDCKDQEIHWIYPKNKKFVFFNTNHLLWTYPYANGIKTGYTEEAGGCLAASATHDGTTLIAVVMHTNDAEDRFTEAKQLLEYGFKMVKMQRAYTKDQLRKTLHVHDGKTAEISVAPSHDIEYPIIKGQDNADYSISLDLPHYLKAPINTGDQVGYVNILYKGKVVGKVPILAEQSSQQGFSFGSFYYTIYDKLASLF